MTGEMGDSLLSVYVSYQYLSEGKRKRIVNRESQGKEGQGAECINPRPRTQEVLLHSHDNAVDGIHYRGWCALKQSETLDCVVSSIVF